MRKAYHTVLISLALASSTVSCGEHQSPTAPPMPSFGREYSKTTVQQGPASLVVYYDNTWNQQRARESANQGLSDAMNLINAQTGTRGLVAIDANVYLQGVLPGVRTDTEAAAGLYTPTGGPADGGNAIFCANIPGAVATNECIAHQLQHRYAQTHDAGKSCWADVLHYNPRIFELVASTTTVHCQRVTTVDHPDIVAQRVNMDTCDTDGMQK